MAIREDTKCAEWFFGKERLKSCIPIASRRELGTNSGAMRHSGCAQVFENPKHPFNVKLNSQLKKAADLKADEYGLFFGSAGHAALYDYPTAYGLQAVAENIWQRRGIVAAVCHGPVLLPGVIDADTGKSIIDGKTVTGFTVEGEVVLKVLDKLTSDRVALVVDAVSKAGADYSSPMHPFDDYSITGRRLITGANPASARSAAERALTAFDELPTAQARDSQ